MKKIILLWNKAKKRVLDQSSIQMMNEKYFG